ncbi:peroxisomal N(1)-acetyl-spermine/spermidine oxidase-like isoform X2 [Penaeus monodon]|uniref:peroxisomal N(1)-acetyl-spermine/spermidine oxidase-like isoform X2 n=1 Tax=Penaeus monodon TaxID=6687 RepID=UPI0018A7049B|nr:peroxisomal N(1)-acetyl-spermine/spermidine oxidase-like isoform X2 [Penaeus monodon]
MYFRTVFNFLNVFAAFVFPFSDDNVTPHPCDEVAGVYSDWVSHAEKMGVAIIGGGVSGLTAAKTLLENDVTDLLILEAKERLGGRVFTVREGNVVVEAGAEWIHGDESNPLYRLAQELNALAPPPPEEWDFWTVSQEGEEKDADPYPVLRELLSELADNASSLAAYRGLPLAALFTDRYKSLYGEESTEEWKGWLHYLNKIVNSAFGCNDWTTPEVTTTGAFAEYGDDNQWAAGYDTLLGHLKASIPDEHIRLSSPVCRIFWDENQEGKREEGQVLIVNKDGSSWLADHVIVTASSGHLQERHRQLFSPPLPMDYVNALEGMELGVANKVQMGWEEPWWGSEPLDLNIIWTKFDLPEEKSWLYDLVIVFSVVRSPHAVVESFVTGKASEIMESLSEEQVKAHYLELLRNATKMQVPEPMFFRRTSWGADPWVRGSYSTLITTSGFGSGLSSRAVLRAPLYAGRRMVLQWAGEHTSDSRFSTVDGAMSTGEREAKRLLNTLRLQGV